MGFFLSEAEQARALAKPRSPPRAKKTIELGAKGCANCPLAETWPRLASPRMPLSGNTTDPDILVLGEAPGEEEDREGVAFIGPSGKMLRKVIPGREMSRLAFQNAARCHPFRNETPSTQTIHACSSHLEEDIARHDFKAILGVGSVPLQYFFPGAQITRVYGTRFAVQIAGKVLWYWPVYHPSYVLQTGGERGASYSVFRADVREFFRTVDKWKTPTIKSADPASVIVPKSEEEARSAIAVLEEPLGFDIETGTQSVAVLRPYKHGARILTAAFSDGTQTIAFPVEHPEAPNSWGLRVVLETTRKRRWIAHNAQMELIWLLWFGRQADPDYEPMSFEDSMAQGRVYHKRNTILSLDDMTRIHLGVSLKALTGIQAARILDYPLAEVLPYNGLDAWASAQIWRVLHKQVERDYTYQHLLGTIRSTTEMELLGLRADLSVTEELRKQWQRQQEEAKKAARRIYEVRQFEIDRQVEFNLASGDHVGYALVTYAHIDLPKTKSGIYSTDEKDLRSLAADNPLAIGTLAFREGQKMESTYFDATEKSCKENIDGLLHPQYTTMRTFTLRLSGEDPNIQNWPKRKHREVRSQIVAPPGHVIVAMDEKQLEARVFGMASKDRALCDSILAGEDIHFYWLHRILKAYPDYIDRLKEKNNVTTDDEAIKAGRETIKTDFVFASFYGSTARSCAERTGLPLFIVEEILYEFWKRYEGAKKWGDQQRAVYSDKGSAYLMTGFERHGYMDGNEPFNTPIQGTGAVLVLAAQNALSDLSRELKEPYLHPRINIHDDLTFILPEQEDRCEEYINAIVPEMIKVRFPWQIIPLAVEVKMGRNWADLSYVADFTGDYVR